MILYRPFKKKRNLSKHKDAINSCNGSAKIPNGQISEAYKNPLSIITSIKQDFKKISKLIVPIKDYVGPKYQTLMFVKTLRISNNLLDSRKYPISTLLFDQS